MTSPVNKPWTLIHGWALGGFFWDTWKQQLPQAQSWNRGYFASPARPKIQPGSYVATHSLGLHWLNPLDLANIEGLIILGGFLDFRPGRRAVKAMLQRLEQEPVALLEDFYQNLFAPDSSPIAPPEIQNLPLLRRDLESLLHCQLDVSPFQAVPNIWILQGLEDQITPPAQAEALAQVLPQAELKLLPQGGHGFAYDKPTLCLDQMQEPR